MVVELKLLPVDCFCWTTKNSEQAKESRAQLDDWIATIAFERNRQASGGRQIGCLLTRAVLLFACWNIELAPSLGQMWLNLALQAKVIILMLLPRRQLLSGHCLCQREHLNLSIEKKRQVEINTQIRRQVRIANWRFFVFFACVCGNASAQNVVDSNNFNHKQI